MVTLLVGCAYSLRLMQKVGRFQRKEEIELQLQRSSWPKDLLAWEHGGVLFISVSFTWMVEEAISRVRAFRGTSIVGGPAVYLVPERFQSLPGVILGRYFPGILQKLNPLATRTTLGCPNRCSFCAIGKGRIEGEFVELSDWPDLPQLCDNNLLAASLSHFDRVMDRLERWEGVDFNQGLDFRLLTEYHAERLARLKTSARIRLALDNSKHWEKWEEKIDLLRSKGVRKKSLSSYALIGFDSDPEEAWNRCLFMEEYCRVHPMWFHSLSAEKHNEVTEKQLSLGWSQKERSHIMGFFYKRRGKIPDYLR